MQGTLIQTAVQILSKKYSICKVDHTPLIFTNHRMFTVNQHVTYKKTSALHSKEIFLTTYPLVMFNSYQSFLAWMLKEQGILNSKSARCLSMCS